MELELGTYVTNSSDVGVVAGTIPGLRDTYCIAYSVGMTVTLGQFIWPIELSPTRYDAVPRDYGME